MKWKITVMLDDSQHASVSEIVDNWSHALIRKNDWFTQGVHVTGNNSGNGTFYPPHRIAHVYWRELPESER